MLRSIKFLQTFFRARIISGGCAEIGELAERERQLMRIARVAAEIHHQFERSRFLRLLLDDGRNSFQEFVLLARFDRWMREALRAGASLPFPGRLQSSFRPRRRAERCAGGRARAAREPRSAAFSSLSGLEFQVQQHLRTLRRPRALRDGIRAARWRHVSLLPAMRDLARRSMAAPFAGSTSIARWTSFSASSCSPRSNRRWA